MKTLTKVFVFLPFCVFSQSNSFRSNIDNQRSNFFAEMSVNISDTVQQLNIGSRFFGINSLSNKGEFYSAYLLGLGFQTNISNKLMLTGLYDYLDGNYNSSIINYQDSLSIYYPGFGVDRHRIQFNVKYLANRFITLDFGHGKQFVGDGYQSLLLSDLASTYPYVKFTTKFGPVKYYNLYTTFLNPNMVDYGRKKHAAIHYLDFAITKKLHFGIFESILWQAKSEEGVHNGYELAYLNPIIFYRPVEFSKKSNKGNALMGANFKLECQTLMLYGQFVLDDLNISRRKDSDQNYQDGFFQNKFGCQLGVKAKIKGVDFLLEYNQVQPYTYGHRTILQNYSHMNQALAHPLGANFKELVNIFKVRNGKWTYQIKTIFAKVGLDSVDTHYGQNIFESDLEASTGGQYSYGNFNGQGVSTDILSFQPEVSFKFQGFDLFCSVYYRIKESDLLNQTSAFYSLGIRTFPFPAFQDY